MEVEEREEDLVDLSCEFAGGRDDDCADVVLFYGFVDAEELFDYGYEVGEGLSTSCDCLLFLLASNRLVYTDNPHLYYNILIPHKQRNGRGLHRRHAIKAHRIDRIENPWAQRFRQLIPCPGILLWSLFRWHFVIYCLYFTSVELQSIKSSKYFLSRFSYRYR